MSQADRRGDLPSEVAVFVRLVLAETAIALVHGLVLLARRAGSADAADALTVPLVLALGPAICVQIFALVSVIGAALLRRTALRMRDDPEAPPPSRSTLADALAAGPRARAVSLVVSGGLFAVPWTLSAAGSTAERVAALFFHVGAAIGAALATEVVFARTLSPWITAFGPQEIESLAPSVRLGRALFALRAGLGVLGAGLFTAGLAHAEASASLDALVPAFGVSVAGAVFTAIIVARASQRRDTAVATLLGRMRRLEEGAGVELVQETGDSLGKGLRGRSGRELAAAVAACMRGVSAGAVAEQTAKKSLEATQRAKTLFVASMSHDLRSPLNSILGFSELLLQGIGGELNDGQRENVLVIQRSGTELLELLNDIIDSARFDSGRMPLMREWTPTVEILTEAVARGREMVEGRAGGRRFQIEPHIDPGLPPLRVDRERIVQAVVCLFRHATEAMDGGVIGIEARRVDTPSGAAVRVDVATGGAIREEDRERLFLAFRAISSPTGKRIGGLGLSLALARSLVRAHGGDLSYSARGTAKASLSVTLPLE